MVGYTFKTKLRHGENAQKTNNKQKKKKQVFLQLPNVTKMVTVS